MHQTHLENIFKLKQILLNRISMSVERYTRISDFNLFKNFSNLYYHISNIIQE